MNQSINYHHMIMIPSQIWKQVTHVSAYSAADRRPGPLGKDPVGALELDTKKFLCHAHFKMGSAYYFQTFVHVIEYG